MVCESKTVLVTGGSGFIGLHLVNELLTSGYKVHTTTRNLEKEVARPLILLQEEYPDHLTLFEADLLKPGSFTASMEGVEAVFHVATPVLYGKAQDNPDSQIRPALDGTLDILNSCLEFPKIQTIILTSSCITTTNFANEKDEYSELDFNPVVGSEMEAYIRAKTLAEIATWEFSKLYQERFRIVTMHPSIVLGPDFNVRGTVSNRSNIGKDYLQMVIQGISVGLFPDVNAVVDVRDVAIAHIRALEFKEATGRFLLNAHGLSNSEIIKNASIYLSKYKMKNNHQQSQCNLKSANYINTKSKEILKIQYRPIEETLRDTLLLMREFY